MKRVFVALVILIIAGSGYAVSPLVAAFRIGEAIKAGDADYLAGRVEWSTVRDSLRETLAPVAMGIPDPGIEGGLSYWQRIKLRLGRGTVNRVVDTYVTPERLPQLFTLGRTYRRVKGQVEPERTLANLPHRVKETWSRIKRGVFLTPTLFEIEAEDKFEKERRYVGLLQLQGTDWRLVSLKVKLVPKVGELVKAAALEDDFSDLDAGYEEEIASSQASLP